MFFNRSCEFISSLLEKLDSFQNILFLDEEIGSMTQDAQCIVSESVNNGRNLSIHHDLTNPKRVGDPEFKVFVIII